MKIYSLFKDYYDIGLSVGFDPNISYERKEQRLKEELLPRPTRYDVWSAKATNSFFGNSKPVTACPVVFCGKGYIAYIVDYNPFIKKQTVFYDQEQLLDHLRKTVKLFDEKRFVSHSFVGHKWDRSFTVNSMVKEMEKDWTELCVLHNAPIVYANLDYGRYGRNKEETTVLNGPLQDLQFMKVLDPFMAFQELSMFIGNVFGTKCPKTLEVSDKIRAEKHGFDKWSFRKPGKKGL